MNREMLGELKENEVEMDSTPTSALRRLQGLAKPVTRPLASSRPVRQESRDIARTGQTTLHSTVKAVALGTAQVTTDGLAATTPGSMSLPLLEPTQDIALLLSKLSGRLDMLDNGNKKKTEMELKRQADLLAELSEMEKRCIKREESVRAMVREVSRCARGVLTNVRLDVVICLRARSDRRCDLVFLPFVYDIFSLQYMYIVTRHPRHCICTTS